jgi:hypothetical protein
MDQNIDQKISTKKYRPKKQTTKIHPCEFEFNKWLRGLYYNNQATKIHPCEFEFNKWLRGL